MKKFLVLIFLLFSTAVWAEVYHCGSGATAIVTHPNKQGDYLYINDIKTYVLNDLNLVFDCYSTLEVYCTDNVDNSVTILPHPSSDGWQILSYGLGALVGIAFVVAVATMYKERT